MQSLSVAWSTWRIEGLYKASKKNMVTKALQLKLHTSLQCAFGNWRTYNITHIHKRGLFNAAVSAFFHSSLAKVSMTRVHDMLGTKIQTCIARQTMAMDGMIRGVNLHFRRHFNFFYINS